MTMIRVRSLVRSSLLTALTLTAVACLSTTTASGERLLPSSPPDQGGSGVVPRNGPAGAQSSPNCDDAHTVKARVVALDQTLWLNRAGATLPGGMIFALAHDVFPATVAADAQNEGASCAAVACTAGQVQLRASKRPRPMVLRVNEGDCLEIEFTNLLAPAAQTVGFCTTDAAKPCDPSATASGCPRSGTCSLSFCATPANKVCTSKTDCTGVKPACNPLQLSQPTTRATGVHVQGMPWASQPPPGKDPAKRGQDDGSFVGRNCSSLTYPAGSSATPNTPCATVSGATVTYKLFAEHEGSYLLYGTGDDWVPVPVNGGDGGTLQEGLFGAVNVQPSGFQAFSDLMRSTGREPEKMWESGWYRSQVTEQDLCWASADGKPDPYEKTRCVRANPGTLPTLDYQAVYPKGHPQAGQPILNMLCSDEVLEKPGATCQRNEIVHTDLTAVITGPVGPDGQPGRFPDTFAPKEQPPSLRPVYSYPDRLQPYREFTILYHESYQVNQAFQNLYDLYPALKAAQDNFGFNYGMGGLSSPILANRLRVGPQGDCVDCKYEEFFLTSWALGDPAMVVDVPFSTCFDPVTNKIDPTCAKTHKAKVAYFPDDPSNVYHSYMSDHTRFRILHAGPDLHHLHHQHAHQWLGTPNSPNSDYLDSQSIGPGSSFTLEMVYNGSGNVNQTVGDSIFHCHFYPHFASGMWSLWRVHDVFEAGTALDDAGIPVKDARAYPDGEIVAGTPIPALVPLPTLPMAPEPAPVRLTPDGSLVEVQLVDAETGEKGDWVSARTATAESWDRFGRYKNPGYPFFIPGIAGARAPHPPLDFASACSVSGSICHPDEAASCGPGEGACEPMDGGLPRHVTDPSAAADAWLSPPVNNSDFSKKIEMATAFQLPEEGTLVEKIAIANHAERFHYDSQLPDGRKSGTCSDNKAPCFDNTLRGKQQCNNPLTATCDPAGRINFVLNGLPPEPGAPFADPCIQFNRNGGAAPGGLERQYLAADVQLDAIFDKEGWHFPQQRMISLWGDVRDFLDRKKPPEPLFMRVNSYDCMSYTLANLVPNVYELDDFQVRTPTDILGQHIHLVKFDVTSSDGATNGWNYEDGTFAPNEVTERLTALKAGGGLISPDGVRVPNEQLKPKFIKFFGPGPGAQADHPETGAWVGSQATVQRWYDDPLYNNLGVCSNDLDRRCTLTEESLGFLSMAQQGMISGCAAPGTCQVSAGFCSSNGLACTEFDKSRCGSTESEQAEAECNPTHDRTIRSVFTHDHFGPSTHQQAGLYAGVVAEPKGSVWRDNQTGSVLGGFNMQTQDIYPGRTVTQNGVTVRDSGPTSWQAVIETPNPAQSYREFMLEVQDTTLLYEPFTIPPFQGDVWSASGRAQFAHGDVSACDPYGDKPCGFCSNLGRCSSDKTQKCLLPISGSSTAATIKGDTSNCSNKKDTCLFGYGSLTACTPENFAYQDVSNQGVCYYGTFDYDSFPQSCNFVAGSPVLSWNAGTFIDNHKHTPVEGITFNNGTYNFSFNYRNEPLFGRTTDAFTGTPLADPLGDMAFAYSSNPDRPSPRGYVCAADGLFGTACDPTQATDPCLTGPCQPAGFCSDNYNLCTEGNRSLCDATSASCLADPWSTPYPALTPGVQPGDPFTPLLRTYASDDVQLRILMGAHINPHNFTVHGLNWLKEPSFVDSGWRNSETMGISEHFVLQLRMDPPLGGPEGSATAADAEDLPWVDYLYKPGAAWLEQASGNWGLFRSYETAQDDLYPLPQNRSTDGGYEAVTVCPADRYAGGKVDCGKKGVRCYDVFATSVAQTGLPGLQYNQVQGFLDKNAIIFLSTSDPNLTCSKPGDPTTCTYPTGSWQPEPLVLRAGAGDCIQVTLWNLIDTSNLGAGQTDSQCAVKPEAACVLDPANSGCNCKGINDKYSAKSNTSPSVGLRPQLVTYDLDDSDGSNAGTNPVQTVPPPTTVDGKTVPASPKTYTWYAGHINAATPPGCFNPDRRAKPTNCGGEGQPACCSSGADYIPIEFGVSNLLPPDPFNHHVYGLYAGLIVEPAGATWCPPDHPVGCTTQQMASTVGPQAVVHYRDPVDQSPASFREIALFTVDGPLANIGQNDAVNYKSEVLNTGNPPPIRYCDSACADTADFSCVLSEHAYCCEPGSNGACVANTCAPCAGFYANQSPPLTFPETPVFSACAGEQVRFRLLQPGGTNTNEVFELYGHNFSAAPYMTPPLYSVGSSVIDSCEAPTTQTNLYASRIFGTKNLCGSAEFFLSPAAMREQIAQKPEMLELALPGAADKKLSMEAALSTYAEATSGGLWDASLNEWKGSRSGHGPASHHTVLVDSAGGPFRVPGDYLWRSYPAFHFNLGIWGLFRVEPPGGEKLQCLAPPKSAAVAPVEPAAGAGAPSPAGKR